MTTNSSPTPVADVSDTPLRPWQGGPPSPPFVDNMKSRAGCPDPLVPMMVDAWNRSSY